MIQAGSEALRETLLQGRLGAPLAQQSKALELGESEEIGCQSHEQQRGKHGYPTLEVGAAECE
jgi:hypothetical protein